ncbi:MAG: hypothetical protein LBN09_08630 [Clostridioides sp.]|nr:hypothetical protein [Clostridioides sp.]
MKSIEEVKNEILQLAGVKCEEKDALIKNIEDAFTGFEFEGVSEIFITKIDTFDDDEYGQLDIIRAGTAINGSPCVYFTVDNDKGVYQIIRVS